jgi:formylglycine-generating enzyme required for sulfatase activity
MLEHGNEQYKFMDKSKTLRQHQAADTQLNREDLLWAIAQQDEKSQQLIASTLGLYQKEPTTQTHKPKPVSTTTQTASNEPQQQTTPELIKSPTAQLTAHYWHLTAQKHRKPKETEKHTTINAPVTWRNRPEPPPYPLLMPLSDMRQRLFPLLRNEGKTSQAIDIPVTIDKISKAEWLQDLPRKQQQHQTRQLHIIDDRQTHLSPYWADHAWLKWQLKKEFADYELSVAVIERGEDKLQSVNQEGYLVEYELPAKGSTVLILSDLGRLSWNAGYEQNDYNHTQQTYWHMLQNLIKNQSHILVISPCHAKDYPASLHQQITLISWEAKTTPLPDKEQEARWVKQLLQMASIAIRLEPELLRSLRWASTEQIPTAMEARCWQQMAEPHHIAATQSTKQCKVYRERLKTELDDYLKAAAVKQLRQWRADLPFEIWLEELLVIDGLLPLESLLDADDYQHIQQDTQNAIDFLQRIIEQGYLQNEDYKAWFSRMESRISEGAVQTGQASEQLQTLLAIHDPTAAQSKSGHVIDPANRPDGDKYPLQQVWLSQKGRQLQISPYQPTQVPANNSTQLAVLSYAQPYLKLMINQQEEKGIELPLDGASKHYTLYEQTQAFQPGNIKLITDYAKCELQTLQKPAWAAEVGQDAYGLYADLLIDEAKHIRQRFRWIASGEFMMGSPNSEEGRGYDENHHLVRLTKGYWLADTCVTQIMWEAITGKNPASFEGETNPVENVSWDDVQTFIQEINQQHFKNSRPITCRLPTEAEWEYACRAGTTTPYFFGEKITKEQVNYNQNLGKTVPVASLPPNAWGLYEMHGNLWEWCADAWQGNLGNDEVVDPYAYGKGSAYRVVRGGSWLSGGGRVRSAFRDHYSPDRRGNLTGFRLLLGHELR